MAPRTKTAPAPVESPVEEKVTRKRFSLDDLTAGVVGADVVAKPVSDRRVPSDNPLVETVQKSLDSGEWIRLRVADPAKIQALTVLIRRIAKENFGKGMRIKADDTGITFKVQDLTKRGRRPKSAE